MTAPSPALHAQLRPVIGAQWINLGLCLSLLSVAFALRDSISPAVWVRSTIILVVSLLMLLCGKEMRRGRRRAYVRAKWIAARWHHRLCRCRGAARPISHLDAHRTGRPSTGVPGAHLDADAAGACVVLPARQCPADHTDEPIPFPTRSLATRASTICARSLSSWCYCIIRCWLMRSCGLRNRGHSESCLRRSLIPSVGPGSTSLPSLTTPSSWRSCSCSQASSSGQASSAREARGSCAIEF